MAQWSTRVQGMPKPNTPITVRIASFRTDVFQGHFQGHGPLVESSYELAHTWLRRRQDASGVTWWPSGSWAFEIKPEDEGVTWCRGHRGPAVDRLAVVASLTHP
jgi:hypothetical protein